jgi:hypothetical protein
MGRPVAAGIFIQGYAALRAIRKTEDIRTTLQQHNIPLYHVRPGRLRKQYPAIRLHTQCPPDYAEPERLFVRALFGQAAGQDT